MMTALQRLWSITDFAERMSVQSCRINKCVGAPFRHPNAPIISASGSAVKQNLCNKHKFYDFDKIYMLI